MGQNRTRVIPRIPNKALQQVETQHLFAVQLNWDSTSGKWEATLKQKGFPDERFGMFETAAQAEECMRLILGKCQEETPPKEAIHEAIKEEIVQPTQRIEEPDSDTLYGKYAHIPDEILNEMLVAQRNGNPLEGKTLSNRIREYHTRRRIVLEALQRIHRTVPEAI